MCTRCGSGSGVTKPPRPPVRRAERRRSAGPLPRSYAGRSRRSAEVKPCPIPSARQPQRRRPPCSRRPRRWRRLERRPPPRTT
ncbi:hypothetical protein C0R04_19975 [Streptomyces albidoflavus]|nr:hypothetical protein C0R04_19975 [Streptomyces albidoflavus]RZE91486.1 hypothetical protein C0R03_19990 [Streptomyces albidoflavus]